ncbi:Merozoite surface protein 1 [Frankliniella fusca]|uniref:Merozoite surface protein 1 n=1 Tax=Frankliniella fusca TaxID=407009 RepID=A0AAE1I786_9NEOP|nr:Merozoite surface protein 1 [Frankliniella fusca]
MVSAGPLGVSTRCLLAVPVRPDAQPTPPPLVPLLTPLTVSVRPPESSPSTSSDLSPASSDISSVSTSTSTTPTPSSSLPARKGRKRKSGISGDEAAAGLASGQYKLKQKKILDRPLVVVDDPTEAETGNVQCQRCLMCFAFDSNNTTGSSSLTKHARAGCRVPRADSTRSVLVPARMKNMLFEKLVEKCARDLSSLHSAVGPGMTGVVQAALDIGSACPGARAADIMPTANTVRRPGLPDWATSRQLGSSTDSNVAVVF